MAYNFPTCDREQAFLPSPDVRDWLPADQPRSSAVSHREQDGWAIHIGPASSPGVDLSKRQPSLTTRVTGYPALGADARSRPAGYR
jgi:hypothetical protein